MKIFVLAALFTLALAFNGLAQKCKEYSATGSSFAFCPPEGWTKIQKPGEKDVEFESSAKTDQIPSSIVVTESKGTRDRGQLAYELIKGFLQEKKGVDRRLMYAGDFDTTSGLHGTRLVFFLDDGGLPFVQAYILVDGPKNTSYDFTVTGSRNDKTAAGLVEAAVKSVHAK